MTKDVYSRYTETKEKLLIIFFALESQVDIDHSMYRMSMVCVITLCVVLLISLTVRSLCSSLKANVLCLVKNKM